MAARTRDTRRESGFTVIEALITTVILAGIIVVITQLSTANLQVEKSTRNKLRASEINQGVLQSIAEELMGANASLENIDLSTKTADRTFKNLFPGEPEQAVALYGQISFTRVDGFDLDEGRQLWSSPILIRRQAGTNQVLRTEGGVTTSIGRDVTDLEFYRAPGRIGVIVETSRGNPPVRVRNRIEVYPMNIGGS